MLIVRRAPRIASSIAGKIWSPFWNAVTRLPGAIAGPSSTDISRRNCGSATAWRCTTLRSIFFSGVAKFIASTTARTVSTTVTAMVQNMGLRAGRGRMPRQSAAPPLSAA